MPTIPPASFLIPATHSWSWSGSAWCLRKFIHISDINQEGERVELFSMIISSNEGQHVCEYIAVHFPITILNSSCEHKQREHHVYVSPPVSKVLTFLCFSLNVISNRARIIFRFHKLNQCDVVCWYIFQFLRNFRIHLFDKSYDLRYQNARECLECDFVIFSDRTLSQEITLTTFLKYQIQNL